MIKTHKIFTILITSILLLSMVPPVIGGIAEGTGFRSQGFMTDPSGSELFYSLPSQPQAFFSLDLFLERFFSLEAGPEAFYSLYQSNAFFPLFEQDAFYSLFETDAFFSLFEQDAFFSLVTQEAFYSLFDADAFYSLFGEDLFYSLITEEAFFSLYEEELFYSLFESELFFSLYDQEAFFSLFNEEAFFSLFSEHAFFSLFNEEAFYSLGFFSMLFYSLFGEEAFFSLIQQEAFFSLAFFSLAFYSLFGEEAFYSLAFYSLLFYSLFGEEIFFSLGFYSLPFFTLFGEEIFYSLSFYSLIFFSLFGEDIFFSLPFYSMVTADIFFSLPFYSIVFFSLPFYSMFDTSGFFSLLFYSLLESMGFFSLPFFTLFEDMGFFSLPFWSLFQDMGFFSLPFWSLFQDMGFFSLPFWSLGFFSLPFWSLFRDMGFFSLPFWSLGFFSLPFYSLVFYSLLIDAVLDNFNELRADGAFDDMSRREIKKFKRKLIKTQFKIFKQLIKLTFMLKIAERKYNRYVQKTGFDSEVPWNIVQVSGSTYQGDDYPDASVQVAILDTGIDTTHQDLAANIAWTYDATGNGFVDHDGHGTHVAGTIAAMKNGIGVAGVYADAEIYVMKVIDGTTGEGEWEWLADAIYKAVEGPDGIVGTADDAEVINMSFGSGDEVPPEYVHEAVKFAYDHGVVMVAAGGNLGDGDSSTNEINYPAAYPEVIAVSATDMQKDVTTFSSSGSYIEVSAPGDMIRSTYLDNSYAYWGGTSMATPHVSGLVALIIAEHGRLPVGSFDDMGDDTIRGILHSYATDLGPSGWDSTSGYGLVSIP